MFAGIDDLFQFYRGGIVAILKDHAKFQFWMFAGNGDHAARVGQFRGHGLFGERVFPRFQAGNGHACVEVMRRKDMHAIDILARDERLPVGRVFAPVFFCGGFCAFRANVANAGERNPVQGGKNRQVSAGYVACADYADANVGRHIVPLLTV